MAARTASTLQKLLLGLGLLGVLAPVITAEHPRAEAAAKVTKKPKKEKGVNSVQDPKVDALVDAKQDLVRECVIRHGIQQGASKVDLDVQLLLSGEGHVADTTVKATVDGGDKKGLEGCIAAALQTIRFPSGLPSMSRVVRTWHFAVK